MKCLADCLQVHFDSMLGILLRNNLRPSGEFFLLSRVLKSISRLFFVTWPMGRVQASKNGSLVMSDQCPGDQVDSEQKC